MLVIGETKCLHCGQDAGTWVGEPGAPLTVSGLRRRALSCPPETLLRCARCDGPVYLEAVSPVASRQRLERLQRLRAQLAELDGGRTNAA